MKVKFLAKDRFKWSRSFGGCVKAVWNILDRTATSDRNINPTFRCPKDDGIPWWWLRKVFRNNDFLEPFDIWVFFEDPPRKFKFYYDPTWITGTLHQDRRTFMISRWIILKTRNVSDGSCTGHQNTQFYVQECSSENSAAYEIMWKNVA